MSARADQVADAARAAGAEFQLVTARELVSELARLGAPRWTPDAVRQWRREQVPVPIAKVGAQGQPNLFTVVAVLDWLIARESREKPKGYTRADGAAALAVLQEARKKAAADLPPIFAANGAAAPEGEGGGAAKFTKDPEVAALARELGVTPARAARALADLDLVISRYRDPRSWKAHEEARLARMKADEQEGSLVPAGEVDQILQEIVIATRQQLQSLPGLIAPALEQCADPHARRALIEQHVDTILQRLANVGPQSPEVPDAGALPSG